MRLVRARAAGYARPAMRSRGLTYGLLIVVAIAIGVTATGMPSRRTDPSLRIAASENADPSTTSSTASTGSGSATTRVRTHDPSIVTVLVANGSLVDRAATKRSEELTRRGYLALTPVNADEKSTTTGVFFLSGAKGDAEVIAGFIGAPARAVRPMPDPAPVHLGVATVLVLLGDDLAA
jgi:hypothetical protein